MIFLTGLSIACFLVLLLLLKSGKKRPEYVLLAWMSFLALHLFLFYCHYSGITQNYPHLLGTTLPLPLLHGVFLYLYTTALVHDVRQRIPEMLLHFVPFVLLALLAIPFYRLPAAEKLAVFREQGRGFEWYSIVQLSAILVSGFAYAIATIVVIYRHRKRVMNTCSNAERLMLRWLEILAIALGAIWLLSAFFDDTAIFTGVVVFVLLIGFFGINRLPVFHSGPAMTAPQPTPVNVPQSQEKPEKYAKTGLKTGELPQIMLLLEALMETEKYFRNCDLTLNDLADALAVPANQLSQVINSVSGKTFYHYVNSWRIREFLALAELPENRKFTFIALAYDCGFNSKTTFNKYFKLHTGKTPSEYFETTAYVR